jgi:NADH:ubiquinone oxidoreductase subunit
MTSIGMRLHTFLRGRLVGTDSAGNRYFTEKRAVSGRLDRRWVLYVGLDEPTKVPPEWHAWLHHTTDAPIPAAERQFWQKPHLPNLSGTAASYRPPGHDYNGGQRRPATGDYESWTPGS